MVRSRADDDAFVAGLRRSAERGLRRDLTRASRRDRVIGVEELHQLHRRLRRYRVELRVAVRAGGGGRWSSTGSTSPTARLQFFTRLVGGVRDQDIAVRHLVRHRQKDARLRTSGYDRVLTALRHDAWLGRNVVSYQALRLLAVVPNPPSAGPLARRPSRDWIDAAEGELRFAQARLATSLARLGPRPGVRRLHEVRKRIRSLGVARHLLVRHGVSASSDGTRSVRVLQALLGRLHDRDVLLRILERFPGERSVGRWKTHIREQRRRLRRAARHDVAAPELRHLAQSLRPRRRRVTRRVTA